MIHTNRSIKFTSFFPVKHGICGDWTFFVESAVVEIDELNPDEIAHLIETESWKGKAGSYDLAGEMGRHARLVDGDELAVLGFAPSALKLLD